MVEKIVKTFTPCPKCKADIDITNLKPDIEQKIKCDNCGNQTIIPSESIHFVKAIWWIKFLNNPWISGLILSAITLILLWFLINALSDNIKNELNRKIDDLTLKVKIIENAITAKGRK